jgi:hypothetical protein
VQVPLHNLHGHQLLQRQRLLGLLQLFNPHNLRQPRNLPSPLRRKICSR